MRIVIDLQAAQSSGSRTRGIGRYATSLAKTMMKQAAGRHEFILALNGNFADALNEVKVNFAGLIEPANFRVWYPPAQSNGFSAAGRRANERLYEAFLASLCPDVVHVASLFEGLADPAVTSVGAFVQQTTAVTLFDLIPLIHAQRYLQTPTARSRYMHKIEALRRANLWMTISESSRQEGIDYLGLDPHRCINISSAASDHFVALQLTSDEIHTLRSRYGLHQPFVMYTGGIDARKNVEGLIRAYALLPPKVRNGHQLAIVCSVRPEDREDLLQLAHRQGLTSGEMILTGFVPEDDLVRLYNLCTLFVFPSLHEGFGLPALEAMRCGAPVIASDTSSLPEVVGRKDALFNPYDDQAIAASMAKVLTNPALASDLREYGHAQAQKFSWDETAGRALNALEDTYQDHAKPSLEAHGRHFRRLRLAYLSPVPPQRSGITHYSTELLPALSVHYDITLITDLPQIDDPFLTDAFPVRSVDWFRENSDLFDRVVYHVGNSSFHHHMFSLLQEIPGVVVLHDFFLGGAVAYREHGAHHLNAWTQGMYKSHGYAAVAERFRDPAHEVILKYPCNLEVIEYAQGIIVHSAHSKEMAENWYGQPIVADWVTIPLVRTPAVFNARERSLARQALGLGLDDLLVCSFGLVGPTKLNQRLLDAWLMSELSRSKHCQLVFVGQNDEGPYGNQLARKIKQKSRNVRVTGWMNTDEYRQYLAAADIGVQLRTYSRGESSAAVLDAMNHGLAVIANANGSMASLPSDAVYLLPDEFTDAQLVKALETLWKDPAVRRVLGTRAREVIITEHAPVICARRYAVAIENFAARAAQGRAELIRAISSNDPPPLASQSSGELAAIAQAICESLPLARVQRQIFLDITGLAYNSSAHSIEPVVKSLLREFIEASPDGYRVEPVRAMEHALGYLYARRFTLDFLGLPNATLSDAPIEPRHGDIFLGLDFQPTTVPQQKPYYQKLRHMGVQVQFVIHDLSSIRLGDDDSSTSVTFGDYEPWLDTIIENEVAVCVSQAIARDLSRWIDQHPSKAGSRLAIRTCALSISTSLLSQHSKAAPITLCKQSAANFVKTLITPQMLAHPVRYVGQGVSSIESPVPRSQKSAMDSFQGFPLK